MTIRLSSIEFEKVFINHEYHYVFYASTTRNFAKITKRINLEERALAANLITINMRERGYDVNKGGTEVNVFDSSAAVASIIQIIFSDEDATIVKLRGDAELIKLQKDIEQICNIVGG